MRASHLNKALYFKRTIMKILILLFMSLVITGCNKSYEERFLDGYAELEIHQLESKDAPKNNIDYQGNYKNVKDTKKALSTLKANIGTADGIANVYETPDSSEKQCVVVLRKEATATTKTHELGHCFHLILYNVLGEKAASVLKDSIGETNGDTPYVIEPFAEVVAATRAYKLDGNFKYLESRIIAIKSKPENDETKPYYAAIPLLETLKDFLVSNENIPQPIEQQILYVTENFYTNPDYNEMFFKLPKK